MNSSSAWRPETATRARQLDPARAGPECFFPDARRAEELDQRMRTRLAASVQHIGAQFGERSVVSARSLARGLGRIARGPVSPLVFGAYFDLVLATDEGNLSAVRARLDELASTSNSPSNTRIVALKNAPSDVATGRYRRLFDTDPENPVSLRAPTRSGAIKCRSRLRAAFALLDKGCPALAAETRALLRVILLAAPPRRSTAATFDGASSFMLWGAIVLNVAEQRTILGTMQALVHESAHNLLFGFCSDGPLVRNRDSERYPSPLRADLRPMDGILHATFVLARMHYALRCLIDSGVLTGAQTTVARRDMDRQKELFFAGASVVERHARLTPIGRRVFRGATAHMNSAQSPSSRL